MRWRFTPRPCPSGVATAASIPSGKAVRTPPWNAADQPDPPAAAAVAQTARAALLPAAARVVAGSGHPQAPRPRHRDPRLPLRSGPRPGFTPRPWRPPVRCGDPACRELGCPRRAPPPGRTSSPCSRPSPWGSRDPPVGGSLADWVAAIQVMLFHTLSSPENRSHGHSGRFGGRFVESEAVGSPVTHELHSRRGRSTPGFGLSAEELDILAADDRAAETGSRRALDGGTAGGGRAARVRHQVIRLRRSAPMEMARDGRSGVRGHPPTRVFVKQNNIWLLHKPEKPAPPWRLPPQA